MHKNIFIIFILLAALQVSGQFKYTNTVSKTQQLILNLNFEEADTLLKTFSYNETGMRVWLQAYEEFVFYKTTNKNISIDSIVNICKDKLNVIETLRNDSPFFYYCLADVNLMIGALYLEKNELLRAFQYYTLAKSEINKYRNKFPDFNKGYKHELIELSFNNMLYKQLGFQVKNSEQTFLNLFELANNNNVSDSVLRQELRLLCFLLKDFQVLAQSKSEEPSFESDKFNEVGPLESLVGVLELRKSKDFESLELLMRKAYKAGHLKKLNALNLWYGDLYLNELNDSAIIFFRTFIDNQHNDKLLNYARYKTGLFFYVNGDVEKSDSLLSIVNNTLKAKTNEDKQAIYEAKHAVYWLPELVKARLLFDGGFYNEALNVLLTSKNNIAEYSKEQRLEYSYRMGRIYHLKNDIEKAKVFYNMVINSKLDKEFYYPAYSAYYLGEMYMNAGNEEKAYYYFALCKELDSPIYELSIHKKAEQYLKN